MHIHLIRNLLITVILVIYGTCNAQYFTAFEDNQKQFWAFEAGIFSQLEEYPVAEFQVGGTLIAYINHKNNFKIYQFGEVKTLMELAQIEFTTTDYLLGYSLFDTLYVYDNEEIKMLTSECEEYLVKDSIIIWQTKFGRSLQVYYNGVVTTIAEGLSYFQLESYMAGDNLFAFINTANEEFNVFYRGELQVIDAEIKERNYQAGCDILAYIDLADQSFNVYHKGEISKLDFFQPKSFDVGDKIVAYIDNQGDLQFFQSGEVKYITSGPEFYEVTDHILVFEEQGSFMTVCNGLNYTLEQYVPEPYYLDVNTIAWLENNESITVFQHCQSISANKINVVKFSMVRDVIVYAENEVEIKVYFNGQVYEHISE